MLGWPSKGTKKGFRGVTLTRKVSGNNSTWRKPRCPALVTAYVIDTPMAPPHWALLERELLNANSDAVELFGNRYIDDRGYF